MSELNRKFYELPKSTNRVASHCIASLETKDKRAHAARASSIERMPPLRCVALLCALTVACVNCGESARAESRNLMLSYYACFSIRCMCIVYALH